jgi:hypothetical protein
MSGFGAFEECNCQDFGSPSLRTLACLLATRRSREYSDGDPLCVEVENLLDNSGVRHCFTTRDRGHELGTVSFGDPVVLHFFECPGPRRTRDGDSRVHPDASDRAGVSARIKHARNGGALSTCSILNSEAIKLLNKKSLYNNPHDNGISLRTCFVG